MDQAVFALNICREGDLQTLRALIDVGHNFENPNCEGKRPLHEAAQAGQNACVELLLQSGVTIDPIKRGDWTPLMLACTKSNEDIVECLLKFGANAALKNKDGWNSFHIAARKGHMPIIECILKYAPSVWKTCSNNLRTPLHTAALHGKIEIVMKILDLGQELEVKDRCGSTPLMDALRAGSVTVAEILVQKKANLAAEDNLGRSCLHLAAESGMLSSLLFITGKGFTDVNKVTPGDAVTPLHLAAKGKNTDVVEFLIQKGVVVNAADHYGRTALHLACASGQPETVMTLLKNGAVNQPDNSGRLPRDYSTNITIIRLFS